MKQDIVWQGFFRDYDECSHSDVYSTPEAAYEAIGFIGSDGTPQLTVDHSWSVEPCRVYNSVAEAKADELRFDPETFRSELDEMQTVAYLSVYYLPALVRKFEEGKRLTKDEMLALGLRDDV